MNELSAFLEAVRKSRDDDAPRLVFADWLDENHPNVPIQRGELPTGFNAHWHRHAMYVTLGVREQVGVRGKWSNDEILAGLDASAKRMGVSWSARAGAAEIGGYPVLVAEPQMKQDRALVVCRALQWAAGGCPVSFNRCAQRGRLRLVFWFTAMPSLDESSAGIVEVMDEMYRNKRERVRNKNPPPHPLSVLQPNRRSTR